jgi:DNA-binding response OmpR family regulator
LQHIPIAFFTSSNDSSDQVRAKKMGAVDYIKKPIVGTELLERIAKIIK